MKNSQILIFLLLVTPSLARITITPAEPPIVRAGGTLHFQASGSVSWSLAPGSAGKIDPDGTYHAPASVPVNNVLAGCQILGNNHIFNVRVDALPVDPHSAEWIALIPPTRVGYYPGWGLNLANQSTPKKPMHFYYTPQNDGLFEMVQWPELKRESGVFTDPRSSLDRHEIAINPQSCDIFEIYSSYDKGSNTGCAACTAQSGYHYNSLSSELPHGSVDAAGMLLTPLTLGLEEMRRGVIDHALRVTFKNNIIARQFIWPARANAGAWGKIPYGTRLRLKPGFDTSKFGPYAQVLLKQLKEYGLIIADGGGNMNVSTYTDVTEDPSVEGAFGEMWSHGPSSSDFEIVDEASLMADPGSGAIKQGGGIALPPGTATVIASGAGGPSDRAQVSVVLQGATVGVPNPSEWMQAGITQQMKAWVNGTSDKRIRWSMEPSLGHLTPEGSFSAPDVQHPTTTTFTAASVADPKAFAKVAVTVLPKGGIRVEVGNATRAPGAPNHSYPDYGPDSEGHMWWRNMAGEVSWGVTVDDPNGPWPKTKDISLYYTSRYSFGDMLYRFYVPNGRYKISLLFAQPNCYPTFPHDMRIPFHLETQGKIEIPDFDMGAGIANACLAPVSVSMPAVVKDQSLYFALRRISHGDHTPTPILSAYSILPDNSAPHLAITPEKIASLSIDQRVPFKTVGWYMGGQAKWSVAKGPGTISQDGIYQAPSKPPAGDQDVVVEASSTADPAKTASASMTFKFGKFSLTPATPTLSRSLSTAISADLAGAKYTNLTWSLEPNIGKISPDGVYTAPDSMAKDAAVTVTAKSKDVPAETASTKLTVKAQPDPIRVNCGRGSFKDAQGNVWSADYGYSDGTLSYAETKHITHTTPDMEQLYQSSRYRYSDQNFEYKFAVPNGRYAVTLKFADYTFKEAGHYDLDVVINGKKVLQNFDFDTVYGPAAAVDKKFETTVTDKSLVIDLHRTQRRRLRQRPRNRSAGTVVIEQG